MLYVKSNEQKDIDTKRITWHSTTATIHLSENLDGRRCLVSGKLLGKQP